MKIISNSYTPTVKITSHKTEITNTISSVCDVLVGGKNVKNRIFINSKEIWEIFTVPWKYCTSPNNITSHNNNV